jgi:hypothetical protein
MATSKIEYDKAAYNDWYKSQNFEKYSKESLLKMDD